VDHIYIKQFKPNFLDIASSTITTTATDEETILTTQTSDVYTTVTTTLGANKRKRDNSVYTYVTHIVTTKHHLRYIFQGWTLVIQGGVY
jgi:hypothetical protein